MPYRTPKSDAEMAALMSVSPFVIASRIAEMWRTVGNPTATSTREASDMVTEKLAAMGESALAMHTAATKILLETATSALAGTARYDAEDADTILAAGLEPYSKRAIANHARLSRLPQR